VSTLREREYPPNPIMLVALTLNYTFVLGLKIWSSSGTSEKDVVNPSIA